MRFASEKPCVRDESLILTICAILLMFTCKTGREFNCQVWWRNIVKYGKYTLAKFAIFLYFCITHGKALLFRA